MTSNSSTEFPEELLSKELTRIISEWQRGDQSDRSLVDLFEVLTHYSRECDVDTRTLESQVRRFSVCEGTPLENQRRLILLEMLQSIRTQLQRRAMNVADRIEANDTARQANASYGDVAHWGHVTLTPHHFRVQS